jgi:hypothetical protein
MRGPLTRNLVDITYCFLNMCRYTIEVTQPRHNQMKETIGIEPQNDVTTLRVREFVGIKGRLDSKYMYEESVIGL